MNLASLLTETVTLYRERTAVRDSQEVWTYGELAHHARLATERLGELGIGSSTRILSLLPGGREFAALMFAVLERGGTLIPAADDISDYQLRWLLADSEPSLRGN